MTSTTQLTLSQLRTAFRDFKLRWPQEIKTAAPRAKKGAPAPAWKGRYVGRGETGTAAHLTQKQADEIARVEDALGWTSNPLRLEGFIRRQLGLPANVHKPVENLMSREATKVITGMMRQTPDAPVPTAA